MVVYAQVKEGGRILCYKVKVCDTLFSRFLGLMFSFDSKLGVLLKTKRKAKHSIHMLFVFRSLDVYWLDEDNRVVHYENAKPFVILYYPKEKARSVLEIPPTVRKIQIGSKVRII
jgi:uncharacterized membrane protein (UPF0127 family)